MAEETQGITAITVGGYKSIREETTIEIRPLTILAGANSSGKSSIMQPMLLMKQTLDATADPGPLLLNGPHIKLTRYEQLVPKPWDEGSRILRIGFEFGQKKRVECEFRFVKATSEQIGRVAISKTVVDSGHFAYELTPDLDLSSEQSESLKMQFAASLIPDAMIDDLKSDREKVKEIKELIGAVRQRILKPLRDSIFEDKSTQEREEAAFVKWEIKDSRCFLYLGLKLVVEQDEFRITKIPFGPVQQLERIIARLIHLPGLRDNSGRSHRLVSTGTSEYATPFHHYSTSLLSRWKEENNEQVERVSSCLQHLGLTEWVEANRINVVSAELNVGRHLEAAGNLSLDDGVNIADVGIGVSQILPVVVALVAAEPDQMVYIEQPELHLHPRAQVALADLLARAAKRGVRVVVETHSSLLLQGIMTLIAEGDLSNRIVKLHWFERNEAGDTIVTSKDFHENGTHDGNWPVDFADIRLGEQRRYLDAVARRRMGLVNEPS